MVHAKLRHDEHHEPLRHAERTHRVALLLVAQPSADLTFVAAGNTMLEGHVAFFPGKSQQKKRDPPPLIISSDFAPKLTNLYGKLSKSTLE